MSHIKTAPVDMFITLRHGPLIGRKLSDIKAMQTSISKYGLLSPIIISRMSGKLVVLDGRKRLAAIRRLDFMGRLPRSLVNIPYIEIGKVSPERSPRFLSNRDLYVTVTEMFRDKQDIAQIAAELFLTRDCVKQILTLCRLSPLLRRAFFDGNISLDCAKAYAAFPSQKAQTRTFMSLGPFACVDEILDQLSKAKPKAPVRPRLERAA